MEDASKAIELAVGVIIFVIAITIAIVLYNRLADVSNNSIGINETQNSVIYDKEELGADFGYIYKREDIYYLIQELKAKESEYGNPEIKIKKREENGNITNISSKRINNISMSSIPGSNIEKDRYSIEFNYKYDENDMLLLLNNHELEEIIITLFVE